VEVRYVLSPSIKPLSKLMKMLLTLKEGLIFLFIIYEKTLTLICLVSSQPEHFTTFTANPVSSI